MEKTITSGLLPEITFSVADPQTETMSLHYARARYRQLSFFAHPALMRRAFTFREAIALSLALHLFMLWFCAQLLSAVHSTRDVPSPLLLEFAFIPDEQELKAEESAPAIAPPLPSQASSFNPTLVDEPSLAAPNIEEAPATTPLAVPDNVSAYKPHELASPAAALPSALIAARIPLAQKEQQRFEHELAKLATKPLFLGQKDTSLVFKSGEQVFTATVRHKRAANVTAIDEAEVTITTIKHGQQWQTRMRLKRLAFSHFAQFVDEWDPRVAVHDDQLNGRFHTNSGFTISSSRGVQPKFQGKVTTAALEVRQSERWGTSNDKEIFQAGLETGAREIRMPKPREDFFQTANLPDSLCHRIEEEAWLIFHPNGSYSSRLASQATGQMHKLPRQPFLISGGKHAVLHVRGVLSGKVLVQSERRIVIDDDLVYAQAPETAPDSEDYLGLRSRQDIVIASPQSTGPGDLHIHAAIFASGKFEVTHLFGSEKATLHIYGSLSVGSLSATEPRYATRLRFDPRLEQRRPPYFPLTNHYEITDWQPEWRMVLPENNAENAHD